MWESRIVSREETQQEKRYQRGRVHEEGEARLEGRGKLSLTARAVRDGSFGRHLLTNTGLDCTLTINVTPRIAQEGLHISGGVYR